jgi:nitroreductase
MDKESLAVSEIEVGKKLADAMERSNIGFDAALWLYEGDSQGWKYIVVPHRDDQERKAFLLELSKLINRDVRDFDIGDIRLLDKNKPVISALSKLIRIDGVGGVRASRNTVNGQYVDDAYIYRMAIN